jgi:hypothetical protein
MYIKPFKCFTAEEERKKNNDMEYPGIILVYFKI